MENVAANRHDGDEEPMVRTMRQLLAKHEQHLDPKFMQFLVELHQSLDQLLGEDIAKDCHSPWQVERG